MLKAGNLWKEERAEMGLRGFFLLMAIFATAGPASVVHGQLGDTISTRASLRSGQMLVSAGGDYQMGFFTPGNSGLLYLGIWYNLNVPERTIVWVANRDSPLKSSATGFLNLTADGNLVIADNSGNISWSTNTTSVSNPFVRLLDSGNLVLSTGDNSQNILWQSFDYPFNTLLPDMKLGLNLKTNLNTYLTSWKGTSDPSSGDYYYKIDASGVPEFFILENTTRLYRSGPWNGVDFSGRPEVIPPGVLRFGLFSDHSEIYYSFQILNKSNFARLVLNESGEIQRYRWEKWDPGWKLLVLPKDKPCDDYASCGVNGVCVTNYSICLCLLGYHPKNQNDWNIRLFFGGCMSNGTGDCQPGDGFLELGQVKLPDTSNATSSNRTADECREYCLNNCSCTAYNVNQGSGCITWFGDLIDTRLFDEGGDQLYYRVPGSLLASKVANKQSHNQRAMIVLIVCIICGTLIFALVAYFIWKKVNWTKGMSNRNIGESFEGDEELELPLFDLNTISAATNNFSSDNKLGEGGFGFVYKGKLHEGQEVAVKRLSRTSIQGVDEFKNEITLIAKLQHRNLVRILGYCIEGEERLLIYEYMPHKSLDAFLFDKHKGAYLNWETRYSIIIGIARGLLYLHQDSRLRIIHRDLKASNILLDKEMNPKISDFGLARIFGGDNCMDKTKRIAGTYGYMSPEYAMDGIFSVKSDVFSFGVLVLEIISGQKNRGVYLSDQNLFLLGNTWYLWNEGRSLELVDPLIGDSFSISEAMRCIKVGMLCIQELPKDRPTMSSVVTMLDSNGITVLEPKQPGFVTKRVTSESSSSAEKHELHSTNDLTMTLFQGR